MENFEFYNPVKIIYGPGELKRIGEIAQAIGKKALIVTYREHSFLLNRIEQIEAALKAAGIESVRFCKAIANPTIEDAREGVILAKKENVDFVIGLGGGSVMDTAKVIAAGVLYKTDIWDMIVTRHDRSSSIPPDAALPTIMVPTMPATSSEMNAGAVITNKATKVKSYVFNPCLYPKVSILDPELTLDLPPYQTACGVADAISHVMEIYLNGTDDTPLADAFMEGVIRTLMTNGEKVLMNPRDIKARGHIQWAATVAWNGWTTPGTASATPMHMLGHTLSAQYNITHGATLAIIMPAWMRYHAKTRPDRYLQLGQQIFGLETRNTPADEAIKVTIDFFESYLKKMGIPTRLSEVNVPSVDIPMLTDEVVEMAFTADGVLPGRPNSSKEDVAKIFQLAL